MIYTWLANGAVRAAAVFLAVLGLIMTPVAAVQTVRLDGLTIPFLGLRLVDGALHAAETAKADLATCRTNTATLRSSLDVQNAAVAKLGQEMIDTRQRAAAMVSAAIAGRPAAAADQAAIMAAKAGPDICKSADNLILEQAR